MSGRPHRRAPTFVPDKIWFAAKCELDIFCCRYVGVEVSAGRGEFIVAAIGFTVLLVGIVMIVTPGPGWPVIVLGLNILSAEFVRARRWLRRIKKTGSDLARTVLGESKVVPGPKA
jgi:Flp pilus assembly protein TadB